MNREEWVSAGEAGRERVAHCVQLVAKLKWRGKAGGDAALTSAIGSQVCFGFFFVFF